MNVAVFDLETNGYTGASALSASSIVFDDTGRVLDFFNRFYLPAEPFNPYLTRIHGLTPSRILALRTPLSATPYYFVEDWPSLMDFWEKREVEGVIIHNARFDMSFLPEMAQAVTPCWCSMRGLTKLCALPGKREGRSFKWPKLGEAVGVLCEGPNALPPNENIALAEETVGDCAAHVSLADCFALYRVAARVIAHHPGLIRFRTLSLGFKPPETVPCDICARPRRDAFTDGVLELEQKLRGLSARQDFDNNFNGEANF